MKIKHLLLTVILMLSVVINAQEYNNLWKAFDKKMEAQLPESANSVLESIERQAVKDKNDVQLLKVVVKRCELIEMTSETPSDSIVNYCESMLPKLSAPSQAILIVEVANYCNSNRSNGKLSFENQCYRALENVEVIKTTEMQSYEDIFIDRTTCFDTRFEPTVYDYVLHNLLKFYSKNIDKYSDEFENIYSKLIEFDEDNSYNSATIFNIVNKIDRLVSHYNDSKHNELYFNQLNEVLKKCTRDFERSMVKTLQVKIMMQEENFVEAILICDEVIAMDSISNDYEICKQCRENILKKTVLMEMQNVQIPNQAIPIGLTYKNTTNLSYRIYQLPEKEYRFFQYIDYTSINEMLALKEICKEGSLALPEETDYKNHSSLMSLPPLDNGAYIVVMSVADDFENEEECFAKCFQVSNLTLATYRFGNRTEIYTLDRETGKPIGDVTIEFCKEKFDGNFNSKDLSLLNTEVVGKINTDSQGFAIAPDIKYYSHVNLRAGKDNLIYCDIYNAWRGDYNEKASERVDLFTDRPIYRPGQTVHLKGVVVYGTDKSKELVANKQFEVSLRDANYQTIEKQTFTTDEYGSFSGDFVLPKNVLNGDFSLKTDNGYVYFKVEEYKRPTFEITFENPEKEYAVNDNVRVTGNVMALSGFGLDKVEYEYSIVRRTTFPFKYYWLIYNRIENEQIASGKGITDAGGLFNIDFQLLPDTKVKVRELPMFSYIIKVKATASTGETRENSFVLNASFNKYNFAIEFNEQISNENGNIITPGNLKNCKVAVTNISGNKVATNVECKIYKMPDNERFARYLGDFDRQVLSDSELVALFPHHDYYRKINEPNFNNLDLVYNKIINVNGEALLLNGNVKMEPGNYIVELKSLDDTLSVYSEKFIVFEPESRQMPANELLWTAIDKTTAQPGETIDLYIGSAANDVTAFLVINNNDSLLEKKCIKLNNNVIKVPYKVKQEDRGRLQFTVVLVKYNEKFENTFYVSVLYDNLKLNIKLKTERDDLLPGSAEKWSLHISDYKGKAVVASLMAGMYDASLDNIIGNYYYSNEWNINVIPSRGKTGVFVFDFGYKNDFVAVYPEPFDFQLKINPIYSDVRLLPTFWSDRWLYTARNVGKGYDLEVSSTANHESLMKVDGMFDGTVDDEEKFDDDNNNVDIVQVRSNFNETAFFYPNITTDKNGDAELSFMVPDALTRWKLRMLAYTKDLKVGTSESLFVTRKPLMIMADMPRFCYDEDTVWLVANVVNLSDEEIAPTAKLEVFGGDPINIGVKAETALDDLILTENEINMSVIPAGASGSVRWKVAMKKNVNLLKFRFSASADGFCDAEQHVLPVIGTEVFMTQTFSLVANAGERKNYDFNFENEGETNHAITLNFSDNPTWYAVKALPYLAEADEKYVEASLHRYFTNSVARNIAMKLKDSPEMKAFLESLGSDSLSDAMSELEKNQELKEILLQETPWVLDAQNEAEQRSNISKLFDNELINKNIESALSALGKKQMSCGGWSWVEGMPESAFVTQYVLGCLGHVTYLVGNEEFPEREMVNEIAQKAFCFIENDLVGKFNNIKAKERKKYHCSVMDVRELFVMSYFPDFPTSERFKEAKAFYIGKLNKEWTDFNYEGRAGIALLLSRNGDTASAMMILNSLRECAQKNELGMYWLETSYAMGRGTMRNSISVEDEARILEAFNEIDPKIEELDAMRFWILGQKQTNMWANDRATAEAVYAIVNRGNDWLNDKGKVVLQIDGEALNKENGETGTGFVKKTLPINIGHSSFSIDNQTNHSVWGGLFRQYFVPIDKVQKSNEDMKIKRELFVERNAGTDVSYLPVSENEIKVGDKVKIVLYIENQRDMEFVYLKDLRGACFEPTAQVSRYYGNDGLWYYQSTSDVAMEFFFDRLPRGRHELSHTVYVTKEGSFSAGYAVIQCQYAPEFGAYSEGERIEVRE